jgi:hypothetical protein
VQNMGRRIRQRILPPGSLEGLLQNVLRRRLHFDGHRKVLNPSVLFLMLYSL